MVKDVHFNPIVEKEFYNKDLNKIFGLDEKDYNLFRIFFASKFEKSINEIETQKDKLIKIFTNKDFLFEYDVLLSLYIEEGISNTKSEKDKVDQLIKYDHILSELEYDRIKKYDCIDKIKELVKNTELLGDLVIHHMVESIMYPMEKKYNHTKCKTKLRSFLNSNTFMYHMIKSLTDLDLGKFFPKDFIFKIRLSKRINSKRDKEIFNLGCIDYKYYANLVEQIIGYLFIRKGYKYVSDIFDDILWMCGLNVSDFMDNCTTTKSKPYNRIVLHPGCSCKNKKGKSICDNPKIFEPQYFKNSPCPEKCRK
jgi:hypothetical protein